MLKDLSFWKGAGLDKLEVVVRSTLICGKYHFVSQKPFSPQEHEFHAGVYDGSQIANDHTIYVVK